MNFLSKSFLKSFSILFTGTVLAQIISYSVVPIITRQYSPDESAYLGLFLRITALGAAIATARLELAFPIEKEKHHAFGIFRFSIRFSALISIFSFLLILLYSSLVAISFQDFLFAVSIPVGVFLTAFINQGSSWSLRNEDYIKISKSTLLLSTFTNGFKILFGLLGGNFLSLIGATLLGYCISMFAFLKEYVVNKKTALLNYKSKRTKVLVKKNADLYTYNLPHVIIDLTRDILIASVIWSYYGKLEYGSYDHAFRMLKLPVVFIGAALGQVFFKKCSVLIQENKSISSLVKSICYSLFFISIIPFGIIAIFGTDIFSFVFSDDWKLSGEMGAIMSPWLFINFIISPISYLPVLLNKQKSYFWVNLIGTLLMIVIVMIPYLGVFECDIFFLLKMISYSQSLFLIFLFFWLFKIVKNYKISEIK